MKVIIAGSRSVSDIKHVEFAVANSGFEITEVVSGGAPGVDRLGENWAYRNKVHIEQFIPEWKKTINHKVIIDKSAGYRRNRLMGDYADALIAVYDGSSNGTKGMIDYMQRLKKPVCIYNVNTKQITITDDPLCPQKTED